jgi:hypothetical protein
MRLPCPPIMFVFTAFVAEHALRTSFPSTLAFTEGETHRRRIEVDPHFFKMDSRCRRVSDGDVADVRG